MADRQRIKVVKADWSDIVLVCRKCSKKVKGGFGPDGRQSLRKALLRLGAAGETPGAARKRRRALAVIEVGCQDLCPKNAVVAGRPALSRRWFVVPKGMPVATVAAELGLQLSARPEGLSPAEPGPEPGHWRLDPSSD